jgi:hypothetical protein
MCRTTPASGEIGLLIKFAILKNIRAAGDAETVPEQQVLFATGTEDQRLGECMDGRHSGYFFRMVIAAISPCSMAAFTVRLAFSSRA